MLKKGVMFFGIWAMHVSDGPKYGLLLSHAPSLANVLRRATEPKVYTDHAFGNDVPFNWALIAPLYVDTFNRFAQFTVMKYTS